MLEKLLRRRCFLLLDVYEALLILAELFSQSPRRPQEEIHVRCPGLAVRFWILNRDVVHQMVMVHAADAFDNVQSVAVRVPDAVEPSLVVEIHGVGDQGVSLPMPNGVSHPRGTEIGIVWAAVREDLVPHGIPLEKK